MAKVAKVEKPVTVIITREAADCLAFFVDHPMYGDGKPDLSAIIVQHFHEWCHRDGRDVSMTKSDNLGEFRRIFKR